MAKKDYEVVREYAVKDSLGNPERVRVVRLIGGAKFHVLENNRRGRGAELAREMHLLDDARELTIGPHGALWHAASGASFHPFG